MSHHPSIHVQFTRTVRTLTLLAALVLPLAICGGAEQEPGGIPLSQIGAKASTDYHGDALAITATAEGAQLKCGFQKLEGRATAGGLWLESSAEGGGEFRVVASAVGRRGGGRTSNIQHRTSNVHLANKGEVSVGNKLVRFARPGLEEEYSVSVDGVRQDFVVLEKPSSSGRQSAQTEIPRSNMPNNQSRLTSAATEEGALRVELAVSGARVEAMPGGAQLVLEGSRRKIAYSRLRVADATGKELSAWMEVMGSAAAPAVPVNAPLTGSVRGGAVFDEGVEHDTRGACAPLLAILVNDTDAVYPVRIDPTFSDADWVCLNQLPGANQHIEGVAADGSGNLYVGGWFTIVGNVEASRVAMWDGSSWSALGSGMDDWVRTLVVVGTDLYAGGEFTTAGGVTANHIAKWDGSSWSALGSGVSGSVRAVVADGTDLYAGGSFTTAGGVTVNNIAKWNGSNWSALGSGVGSLVRTLAVSGGDLYVGGDFTKAGGMTVNHIARWNGSSWSALGSGLNDATWTLAANGTDVYAGGEFTTAGGLLVNNIAKWDGSSWSPLGSGVGGSDHPYVLALAVSGSDLYVGGQFTTVGGVSATNIAKWDGSSWSGLGSGIDSFVHDLVLIGGDLFVGGEFYTAGGVSALKIARWNGSTWSSLGSGVFNSAVALAVNGTDLYAAATRYSDGFIYKWDGNVWSIFASGIDGYVGALAGNGTDLYAGGQFTTIGGIGANNIAKWNGSSWSAIGSGMNSIVEALAVNGSDLYAGGAFTTAGGVTVNQIARWNGSTWSALGSGMGGESPYVFALVAIGADLYAGGHFTTAGGVPANNIAKWNGSAWSALGSGMDGSSVRALALNGADLYAGGGFSTAGGISATNIAKWNGSSWSALGPGLEGEVYALAVDGTDLYVGGTFTTAGGVTVDHIAKWNGSTWSALGSGLSRHHVIALATDNSGHLFVGGDFTYAGTNLSPYVAQANIHGLEFTWDAIASPEEVDVPFPVSLTARSYAGAILTYFSETVNLSGFAPGIVATNISIGTGTTAWVYPLNTLYHDARTQVIYPASELDLACTINSLALDVTAAPGQALENWTIRMKHTSLAEYSTSPEWEGSDWTVVYQANEPAGSAGWRTFTFSTPFEYDGTNNLLIDFSFNNAFYSSEGQCQSTIMGAYRSITFASDSKDGDPLTWSGTSPAPVRSQPVPNLVLAVTFPDLRLVSLSPTVITPFVSGVWTGEVTVHEAVSNLVLRGDDGLGHDGQSNPFDVQGIAQPPVIVTDDGQLGITNGHFGFNVQGQAGQVVVIEVSTNLADWLPLQTNILSGAPWYFSDPDTANFTQRFYRAVTP